jgi:hypothetical protein
VSDRKTLIHADVVADFEDWRFPFGKYDLRQ